VPSQCLARPAKIMATATAPAYLETAGSASENLSPFRLKHLVRYSGIPLPQRHLILAALEISQNAGVVVWSSVRSLSVETKMSERTIYHRRRRMLKLKLWEPIRAPYTWDDCPKCGGKRESRKCACGYEGSEREFRRPPTFRLNVQQIASWPRPKGVRAGSYKEYRNSADYPAGKKPAESGHRSTSHASPSNAGVKREVPAAKPALVAPSRSLEKHGISRAEDRLHKRRLIVSGAVKHYVSKGMTQEDAILEAVRATGHTREEVEEDLRVIGFKSPGPLKKMRPEPEDIPFERNPWKKILRALKANLNPHSFGTWFVPTRLDHETAGTLFVRVPTSEFLTIGSKYNDLIRAAINSLGLEIADVKFVTGEEEP
jgi:hypothetical protein